MCVHDNYFSRHCLFTWHNRGDILLCLSQVGPGGQRPSVTPVLRVLVCVCACVCVSTGVYGVKSRERYPCGRSRGVWQISSPGRIGVNERFNHPAECQSLLGVIASAPLPEINMEKRGWGGKALQRGVDSHLINFWALEQQELFWSYCYFVRKRESPNITTLGCLHCHLLKKCHKLDIRIRNRHSFS